MLDVLMMVQDSVGIGIGASPRDLFLMYQFPIAGVIATIFTYFLAKLAVVQRLGDWWKRGVNILAAGLVVLAVRWMGGEVHPGLADLVGAIVIGGVASGGPTALSFRLAKVQPGSPLGRRGNAKLGLMVSLLFLGACGLIGAGSGKAPSAPDAVGAMASVEADTARVTVRCTVPANTTCRWASTLGTAPDGVQATYALAAPAPGDSVQVGGSVRAVRRGLVSVGATSWSAWIKRGDVAPGAPDSVIVVEIIVPPVVD